MTYAKVTTAEGSLNLRKKAASSAAVLARIPQNEMIEVLTPGEKWTKVAYRSKTGYVMTAFLTFVDVPQPVAEAMTAKVATPQGSLNLREKASSGSKVLRTIPREASVIVLSYGEKWSKVTYGAATGYVKSQFLAFDQPAENAALPRTARVAQAGTALRAAADADAAVDLLIPAGDYVLVLAESGSWRLAEYEGRTGYVPAGVLEYP